MRGNYIGKKPVQYDSITSTKPGVWEIYDQGQFVRDSTWADQPWDVANGVYTNKKWTVGLTAAASKDIQFKTDGTKFYVTDDTNNTVYQYSCSTAWDVSTGSYDNKSFSVTTQEGNPNAMFFKSDGTKFYVVGQANNTVYQYSCSTAWDVSTGSYDSKSFAVGQGEANSNALFFKDDGTKFYVLGTTNKTIYQYSCSTAWDISTASYDSKSFSTNTQDAFPHALFFKSDGAKFYVLGDTNNTIFQYSCSTAWDISTGSYDSVSYNFTSQETSPTGLFFKSDGTKFYMIGSLLNKAYEYSLSTAWTVSTANGAGGSFYVGGQEATSTDVQFKSDGTKFYVIGATNRIIYQYSCSTAWDVSTGSYDSKSFSVNAQENNARGLFFKSDGTKFYIVGQTNDTVYQYSCSTAWDVSTASYDSKSFSVTTQENSPSGLFFKPDGTKFYVIGITNRTVYQYSCSTAWDVSTGSYDSISFNVAGQEITPDGLFFKPDGTRLYVVGQSSDNVNQYALPLAWDVKNAGYLAKSMKVNLQETTPNGLFFKSDGLTFYICGFGSSRVHQYTCTVSWDITTSSYNYQAAGVYSSFPIGTQEANSQAVFFKSDGTKFYIIGTSTGTVYQYSCSTAWDVSTASYDSKSFPVTSQETAPTGLFFKSDGTKLYVVGTTNRTVYQYSCSTAWDVSTASYDSLSFSVNTQETNPQGLTFKDDGTKFYVNGTANDRVYQYACSTAWDISTASYESKSLSVVTQDTGGKEVNLGYYGTILYMLGATNPAALYQYYLTY